MKKGWTIQFFYIRVGNAKNLYFSKPVENNKAISSVWRALKTFTKGTSSRQEEMSGHFKADALNDYVLSLAETLFK